MMPSHVLLFVETATDLEPMAYARIRQSILEAGRSKRRVSGSAPRLSASEFSSLDKLVRSRLRPRADELSQVTDWGIAISATMMAAQALWKPHAITPEVFNVLVEPFREEEIEITDPYTV